MSRPITQRNRKRKRLHTTAIQSRRGSTKTGVILILLLLVAAAAVASLMIRKQGAGSLTEDSKHAWVSDLVAGENLILKLTIELDPLNEGAIQRRLPSGQAKALFGKLPTVVDINDETEKVES